MLMKNPDQRIKISQFFLNEFVLTSTLTHISDHNTTTISNANKVKSISNFHETVLNENTNSSKSYSHIRNKSNFTNIPSLLDQNMLQLPSALAGYQSNCSSNSILNSEQNCLKSVNSIFIGSNIDGASSSNISEAFSPTHFTNDQKKSSKTYSSNNFSLNNTIKAFNKTVTSKMGNSSLGNEIFWDENPIDDLMKKLNKIGGKIPHPSKSF